MKASNFRIDNLVYDAYDEVTNVDFNILHHMAICDLNKQIIMNYKPIPITEEWLLRFGFEKDNDNIFVKDRYIYWLYNGFMQLALCYSPLVNCLCKYVHQLQNLYFALTGEELEWK